MTQWIKESIRYKEEEVPLRLHPVFIRGLDIIEDIEFMSSIRKSDHELTELKISRTQNHLNQNIFRNWAQNCNC